MSAGSVGSARGSGRRLSAPAASTMPPVFGTGTRLPSGMGGLAVAHCGQAIVPVEGLEPDAAVVWSLLHAGGRTTHRAAVPATFFAERPRLADRRAWSTQVSRGTACAVQAFQ